MKRNALILTLVAFAMLVAATAAALGLYPLAQSPPGSW